jgi:hypothetical protein
LVLVVGLLSWSWMQILPSSFSSFPCTWSSLVEQLRAGRSALEEPDEQALSASMKAKYAGAALDFLIPLGADAVASELATSR